MTLRIQAADLDGSLRFYAAVLGWVADPSGRLRAGDLEIEVVGEAPERKGQHYLVVAVPDVGRAVAAAREGRHPVLREWSERGSPCALLADPDGNLFEVVGEGLADSRDA